MTKKLIIKAVMQTVTTLTHPFYVLCYEVIEITAISSLFCHLFMGKLSGTPFF